MESELVCCLVIRSDDDVARVFAIIGGARGRGTTIGQVEGILTHITKIFFVTALSSSVVVVFQRFGKDADAKLRQCGAHLKASLTAIRPRVSGRGACLFRVPIVA